jgi:hypothetical protein
VGSQILGNLLACLNVHARRELADNSGPPVLGCAAKHLKEQQGLRSRLGLRVERELLAMEFTAGSAGMDGNKMRARSQTGVCCFGAAKVEVGSGATRLSVRCSP